jgi:predicted acylesterase/phospholipase RssA
MGRARTAFVLSGGASLGPLQAGMLLALHEQRITAEAVGSRWIERSGWAEW